ncbi:hypothetical protein J2125_004099 [Erwinia toletana]|uniref:Uncharacterized protein n=1 Tax=Winslowiella toletana TaxID=92490 RepID=A0ABS4PE67_9GAMM|nr:hypothetical protein [Winslowiella toletana]MBP2170907.1 hypothetical protein [Winslowiella toletana]
MMIPCRESRPVDPHPATSIHSIRVFPQKKPNGVNNYKKTKKRKITLYKHDLSGQKNHKKASRNIKPPKNHFTNKLKSLKYATATLCLLMDNPSVLANNSLKMLPAPRRDPRQTAGGLAT